MIGKKDEKITRRDGMEKKKKYQRNRRNREGRKELTPSKITIRKGTVSFFFFFSFFGETHTHVGTGLI